MTDSKKIIGLTGNIATGKSVVRRMLANTGALGIDADIITHRTLYPGGSAYKPVIDTFSKGILQSNGEISRSKLGEIVFNDPNSLKKLEELIHPAVTKAIRNRIRKTSLSIVVVEAIKLLESSLIDLCNTIWVSHASETYQMERLLQARQLSEDEAQRRIDAQPPQSEKLSQADVVINTEGLFAGTWLQVQNALNDTIQASDVLDASHINISENWKVQPAGTLPQTQLETFWKAQTGAPNTELYEALAFHTMLLLLSKEEIKALILWENWNFTATLNRVIPESGNLELTPILLEAFQGYAQMSQCELLILPEPFAKQVEYLLSERGFERQAANAMPYPAWRQAMKRQTLDPVKPIWIKILAQPMESDDNRRV